MATDMDEIMRMVDTVQPDDVVQLWGVDSNTATNLPGDPVAKDLGRIRAFVAAARSAHAMPAAGARR